LNERIDRAIAARHLGELAEILNDGSISEARYAARRLTRGSPPRPNVLQIAEELSSSSQFGGRLLSTQLAVHGFQQDSERGLSILQALLDDAEWPIRDAASEAAGRLLRAHFDQVLARLEAWRSHASPGVRRAVIIAALRTADSRRLERAEPLLRLVEPLLADRDPLVRRNLGTSALGALLEKYPAYTFEYLVHWSTSSDPQVLWNVAMTFSTPAAAPLVKKALIVLRKLSLDERRYVWRAVATALWKLGRRRPDVVRPELARWLEDDRRLSVAREALKYL
jgi:3-methyladenine DNA glycosylase AlkC